MFCAQQAQDMHENINNVNIYFLIFCFSYKVIDFVLFGEMLSEKSYSLL